MQLINDDCLNAMKDIKEKSIDLICCDLPYGTTKCVWDIIIPFDELWNQYNRIVKDNGAILLFGQEPFSSLLRTSNIKNYKYDIYWQKERPTNVFQVKKRPGKVIETISVFYKKQPTYNPIMTKYEGKPVKNKVKGNFGALVDSGEKKPYNYIDTGYRYPLQIVKFNRDVLTSNLHPTQKPLELIKYLIQTFSNENDLVLDNCMGSGTTGVACKELNRNFIGIEKDKNYFEIAEKRINA